MQPSSNPSQHGRRAAIELRAILAASALVALGVPHAATADVPHSELDSISNPDTVETAIGTLEFFDGVPIGDTAQAVYDNLDRMRATDVYPDNLGAVSINYILDGFAKEGADAPNKVVDWENGEWSVPINAARARIVKIGRRSVQLGVGA